MKMNYSFFFKQYFPAYIKEKIIFDIEGILDSGRLINGPFIKRLEQFTADYVNVRFASAVNSCTTALTVCLKHFNVEGQEVLVPANSFVTCVSSIIFAGGQPVLVDVNPDTLSFDIEDLKSKITKKTRGILWPHLLGIISKDYQDIITFCRENSLFLIEDCAQAHGAQIDGKKAGSWGDAACFSFYATKIVAAGSGGLIVSNNEDLIAYANKMRLFGKDLVTGQLIDFGNDWILDEFRSAIVFHHFHDIDRNLSERRKVVELYLQHLEGADHISFLDSGRNGNPAFYQFAVLLDCDVNRDEVIKILKDEYDVDARSLYIPLHQERVFAYLDTRDLKNAEITMNRLLCLPLHHFMKEEDIIYVVDALRRVMAQARVYNNYA